MPAPEAGGPLDGLFPALYDELRDIARRQRRRESRELTLDTTAVVHEAYLRLAAQRHASWDDRARFLAAAAVTMRRVAGDQGVSLGAPVTGAEDFGYYAEKVPGLFVFLGVRPKGSAESTFVSNHSPKFFADEAAMPTGVRALATLATDFLASGGAGRAALRGR